MAWLGPKLAGERQHGVFRRAPLPALETIIPPTPEHIDPHGVVREGNLDLHLLAAGDPAVKRPGAVEDLVHQRMVLR